MKHAKLFTKIALVILLTVKFSFSQEFAPPKPLQNEFFDALVGNVTTEVTRNGKIMTSTFSVNWDLNHQFLIINLTSVNKNNPDEKYQGMGIWGIENSGTVNANWFDIFGADNITKSTGKITGNKLVLNENGKYKSGTATFEIINNSLRFESKGSYNTPDGKQIPYEETAIFMKSQK